MRDTPAYAFVVEGSLVIGSDAGAWSRVGSDGHLAALPSTGRVSAWTQDARGVVTVACYAPRLEQLTSDAWTSIALSTPALALAATPRGLVLADTSGGIALLSGVSRVPVQEHTASEPVVELIAIGGGLAMLSNGGTVFVTTWPGQEGTLVPVATGAIGRAHAMWPGIASGTAIVAGASGVGVLEERRFAAVVTDLGERIAGVAPVGRSRAIMLGDTGNAWVVDERLARRSRVQCSDLVGAAAAGDHALGWTRDGALYSIDGDGRAERLAARDVVLAVRDATIHWTETAGAWVTREGGPAWN